MTSLHHNFQQSPNKYNSSMAHQCRICNKGFSCVAMLQGHVMRIHSYQSKPRCDQCDRRFSNRLRLEKHKNLHSTGRKLWRTHIPTDKGEPSMESHHNTRRKKRRIDNDVETASKHSTDDSSLKRCSAVQQKQSELGDTSTKHTSENQRLSLAKQKSDAWVVKQSTRFTTTSEDMKRSSCRYNSSKQQLKVHHTCEICEAEFTSSSLLEAHLRLHVNEPQHSSDEDDEFINNSPGLATCEQCRQRFASKRCLKGHTCIMDTENTNTHHPTKLQGLKEYLVHLSRPKHHITVKLGVCDLCGLKFANEQCLGGHKCPLNENENEASRRPKVELGKCDTCYQKFANKQCLDGHYCIEAEKTVGNTLKAMEVVNISPQTEELAQQANEVVDNSSQDGKNNVNCSSLQPSREFSDRHYCTGAIKETDIKSSSQGEKIVDSSQAEENIDNNSVQANENDVNNSPQIKEIVHSSPQAMEENDNKSPQPEEVFNSSSHVEEDTNIPLLRPPKILSEPDDMEWFDQFLLDLRETPPQQPLQRYGRQFDSMGNEITVNEEVEEQEDDFAMIESESTTGCEDVSFVQSIYQRIKVVSKCKSCGEEFLSNFLLQNHTKTCSKKVKHTVDGYSISSLFKNCLPKQQQHLQQQQQQKHHLQQHQQQHASLHPLADNEDPSLSTFDQNTQPEFADDNIADESIDQQPTPPDQDTDKRHTFTDEDSDGDETLSITSVKKEPTNSFSLQSLFIKKPVSNISHLKLLQCKTCKQQFQNDCQQRDHICMVVERENNERNSSSFKASDNERKSLSNANSQLPLQSLIKKKKPSPSSGSSFLLQSLLSTTKPTKTLFQPQQECHTCNTCHKQFVNVHHLKDHACLVIEISLNKQNEEIPEVKVEDGTRNPETDLPTDHTNRNIPAEVVKDNGFAKSLDTDPYIAHVNQGIPTEIIKDIAEPSPINFRKNEYHNIPLKIVQFKGVIKPLQTYLHKDDLVYHDLLPEHLESNHRLHQLPSNRSSVVTQPYQQQPVKHQRKRKKVVKSNIPPSTNDDETNELVKDSKIKKVRKRKTSKPLITKHIDPVDDDEPRSTLEPSATGTLIMNDLKSNMARKRKSSTKSSKQKAMNNTHDKSNIETLATNANVNNDMFRKSSGPSKATANEQYKANTANEQYKANTANEQYKANTANEQYKANTANEKYKANTVGDTNVNDLNNNNNKSACKLKPNDINNEPNTAPSTNDNLLVNTLKNNNNDLKKLGEKPIRTLPPKHKFQKALLNFLNNSLIGNAQKPLILASPSSPIQPMNTFRLAKQLINKPKSKKLISKVNKTRHQNQQLTPTTTPTMKTFQQPKIHVNNPINKKSNKQSLPITKTHHQTSGPPEVNTTRKPTSSTTNILHRTNEFVNNPEVITTGKPRLTSSKTFKHTNFFAPRDHTYCTPQQRKPANKSQQHIPAHDHTYSTTPHPKLPCVGAHAITTDHSYSFIGRDQSISTIKRKPPTETFAEDFMYPNGTIKANQRSQPTEITPRKPSSAQTFAEDFMMGTRDSADIVQINNIEQNQSKEMPHDQSATTIQRKERSTEAPTQTLSCRNTHESPT